MNACTTELQDAAKLFDKLIDGDEEGCRGLVAEFLTEGGTSVVSICEVVTEAFYKVGDAWECDQISIYREHIASQIGYRLLQDVRSSLASPDEDAPVAIGCTPERDPYSLPTCMVELVLRDAGWNAHALGTNLPLTELIPAIDHYKPRLCWVSASYTESPNRLRDQLLNLLEAGRIRNANVVCGGRAIPEDILKDSSVCYLGSLRELQQHVTDTT